MSEFNTTGNPEPAGQCANCGAMTYVGLQHICSTGVFYPITPVVPIVRPRRQPPAELWLHIHKDGKTATTYCPEEDCLFGRRVKYVLAKKQ